MIEDTIKSPILYQIMMVLEALQIISFAYDTSSPYLWNAKNIANVVEAMAVFNVQRMLRRGNNDLNHFLLHISASFTTLLLLMAGVVIYCNKRQQIQNKNGMKHKSTLLTYSSKFCALLLILIRTFLSYSMFQIFYTFLICADGTPYRKNKTPGQCYRGVELWYSIEALYGIFVLFGALVVNFMLINDFNPSSRIPFAGFCSYGWVLDIIQKILVPLFSVIDSNARFRIYSNIILIIYFCIMLAKTINANPIFNESVQHLKVVLMSLIIWLYIAVEIRSLLILALGEAKKPETLSFYLTVIGILPSVYSIMTLVSKKENNILLKDIKSLKSVYEVEYQIHRLSKLIEKRNEPDHFIKLFGFLKLHAKNHLTAGRLEGGLNQQFSNQVSLKRLQSGRIGGGSSKRYNTIKGESDLNFNTLADLGVGEGVNPWEELIYQEMKAGESQQDSDAEDKQANLYNRFLEHLIKQGLKSFPKSASLRLYLAFFQYFTLKVHWKPVYLLRQTFNLKSSLMEEFAARRTLKIIEHDLRVKEEMRRSENDLNVIKVVAYTTDFKKFMKSISTTVEMTLEFWLELSNEAPDSNKLMSLGSHILRQNRLIKQKFEALAGSEVKTSLMYTIFGGYIKLVMHDEENFSDVLDKVNKNRPNLGLSQIVSASDFEKNVQDRELAAERMNGSMCVIEVSGNEDNLGEIRMASNSVWGLFGYKPGELIGQNIDSLMPKFFAERHDQFMQRFLLKEQKTVVDVARVVFGLHQDGYLRNFRLLLKYLPDLSEGIRLIGIVSSCTEKDFRQLETLELNTDENKDTQSAGVQKPEVHTVLINYTTGDIIGVSDSCYYSFGLKSQLFNQSNSSNSPNIELIAPELVKGENLAALRSDSGLICRFDTTVLNDNYYFVGSQDGRRGGGKRHRRKENGRRRMQDEDPSSRESEGGDQDENGGFDQETFDEDEELFRSVQIRAWFDKESQYGDSRLVCLRFMENVDLDDPSNRDSYTKYLKDVDPLSEISNSVVDGSPAHQKGSGASYKNGIDSEDNDSFDQMRTVKLTREIIADKKSGLIISMTNFVLFLLITVSVAYSVGYYFESEFYKELEIHFNSKISMFRRGLAITDIRFYNRKLELLSSDWISTNRQAEHQKAAEKISNISNKLVKYEDESMDALNDMRRIRGSKGRRYLYDFYYKLSDNRTNYIQSLYQDGIYQYLSSASIIKNSKLGEMDRRYQISNGGKMSKERMHFYRINYNSIKPLRQGNKEILEDFTRFVKGRIFQFRVFAMSPAIVHLLVAILGTPIAVFCTARILNNDGDVLKVFSVITYEEIEQLVDEIDSFREEYLREFLVAEDLNFEEDGGYEDDDQSSRSESVSSKAMSSRGIYGGYLGPGEKIEMVGGDVKRRTRQNSNVVDSEFNSEAMIDSEQAVAESDLEDQKNKIEFVRVKSKQKKKKNKTVMMSGNKGSKGYNRGSKRVKTNPNGYPAEGKAKNKLIERINRMDPSAGSVASRQSSRRKMGPSPGSQKMRKLLVKKKDSSQQNAKKIAKKFNRRASLKKRRSMGGADSPGKNKNSKNPFEFTVTATRAIELNKQNEEEEEIVAARTQQIISQAKSNGCCFLASLTIPSLLLLVVLLGGLILIKFTCFETFVFINENTSKLGSTPNILKTGFNVMYESLSVAQSPLLIEGKDIFSEYLDLGYSNIGNLTQNNNFPPFMSTYSELFNELVFVKICDKYIKVQTNQSCSEELYNTGLETISIYILENSRKQLNSFNQAGKKEQVAKSLINSDEMAQLEKIVMLTGDIFDYMFSLYSKAITGVVGVYDLLSLAVLSVIQVMTVGYLFLIFCYVLPYLRRQVLKSRGMLKIIPTEILTKNKRVLAILMKGKEDLDRNKKLRRRRRRNKGLAKGY